MTEASIGIEAPRPPERLSDEQMGNLLSAVGNHEAKAITLLLMKDGNAHGMRMLHKEFLDSQGAGRVWEVNPSVPYKYSSDSFLQNDLVTEEAMLTVPPSYGYKITDSGKEIAVPLSGLMLDFSDRHNIPLSEILGPTRSGSLEQTTQTEEGKEVRFKKRAPLTTLKLIKELLKTSSFPLREADIVKLTGEEKDAILSGLTRLSKLNLIQFTSKKVNVPFVSYKLSTNSQDDNFEREIPVPKGRKITLIIFDILKKNKDKFLTLEEIFDRIPFENKAKIKSNNKQNAHISEALSFLAKHNLAEVKDFHSKKQSEICLNDNQRKILEEFYEIINKIQSKDRIVLEKGRKLANDIIGNSGRVSALLRRAKESSSNAYQSSKIPSQESIVSFIFSHPGSTNEDLTKMLMEKLGRKFSKSYVRSLTTSLEREGFIVVINKGKVKKFFLAGKNSLTS